MAAVVSHAHIRLGWALAVSLGVHGWLATGTLGDLTGAAAIQQPSALAVWLEPVQPALIERPGAVIHGRVPATALGPAPISREATRDDRPEESTPDVPASLLPQSPAAYFTAHELDVYPMPLAPLALASPDRAARGQMRGSVSAEVLIDELGAVREVHVVAADPPGYFEEATRAALAAARFSPGRRSGQPVKSRLTISVEYGPGALQ